LSRREDSSISSVPGGIRKTFSHKHLSDLCEAGVLALPLLLERALDDSGSHMKPFALLIAGLALAAAPLASQAAPASVPDSHRPPPGMCRIWIDGVPPTHQPAPTDCATAIRRRPVNAHVVFGSAAPPGSQHLERSYVPPAPPAQSARPAPENAPAPPSREDRERERAAQPHRDPPPRAREDRRRPSPAARPEKASKPPHQSYSPRRPR
jgi:hypothetical protein